MVFMYVLHSTHIHKQAINNKYVYNNNAHAILTINLLMQNYILTIYNVANYLNNSVQKREKKGTK